MNNNNSKYKTISLSLANSKRKKTYFFTPKLSSKVTKCHTPHIKYFSPIRYNIAFNSKSNKDIITSPPYIKFPTRNYEIQTLCKDYHYCLFKTDTKKHISNHIDSIETKMNTFTNQIKQTEKIIDAYEEDNLEIIFKLNNNNIYNKIQNVAKEIQNEKSDIEDIRKFINKLNKETHSYNVEEIKMREEIVDIEEKEKMLESVVWKERNEVHNSKKEIKELKSKVIELRKMVKPQNKKFSVFLKDIAKLISNKPI